ncbi:methylamine utilization protein [Aliiglaciecola sp. M165]|uniref:methylamine utilization protein n=1 Tax=Aliiglaciecola sp. M165 TaxID=2593649 RepID=UPI00118020FC|nr:methylamine utilization protein [Aliiglaciecola sp. M165]TRY33022.1 methylamine utilization protein [Aliiglaciecola sp. M165]
MRYPVVRRYFIVKNVFGLQYLVRKLVSSLLILFLCCPAFAQSLTVVDQHGKPVENAVVSFPMSNDALPKSKGIAIMDQVNKQFLPRVLVVDKGQYVSFPNSDDIRHHVYSFSSIKPFEIKLYKGSDEPPVLYDKAGIGVLGCNIHDGMVGYIYVTDNEIAKVTNASGQIMFDETLPKTIQIWHEDLSFEQTKRVSVPVSWVDSEAVVTVELVRRVEAKSRSFGSRKFGSKG